MLACRLHPLDCQRRWPVLLVLVLLGAGTYPAPEMPAAPPQAPLGEQTDSEAVKKAAAGWAQFEAAAKAAPATESLILGTPKCWRITHALHTDSGGIEASRWTFVVGVPIEGLGLRLVAPSKGIGLQGPQKIGAARVQCAVVAATSKTVSAVDWSYVCEVELRSRMLGKPQADQAVAPVPELRRLEAREALVATAACDWATRDFQAWLTNAQLRPRADESDLVFARRVLASLLAGRTWHADPMLPVRASRVPKTGPLCCWESASLMVGALRAAGVPARAVVGFFTEVPAGYTDPGQKNAHVRIEFFARGIGWVPADPTPPKTEVTGDALAQLAVRRLGADDGAFVPLHHELGLEWKNGGRAFTFRMLPGFYVEGAGTPGKAEISQVWRAEAIGPTP